ncbi:unnamed protein product [Meganyctiphanes norvegica]|uniref:C-type lectin domain-containing protein n=2 Tax=Meganyctiphanes norvegica TaxID=48144 RepID=A0AAV2SMF1_MEGNR
MHPFDAKERCDLYKMNFLTTEQLIENLTILLKGTNSGEDVNTLFPSEEDIINLVCGEKNNESATKTLGNQVNLNYQQPIAVVWDIGENERYWYVGLFIGDSFWRKSSS